MSKKKYVSAMTPKSKNRLTVAGVLISLVLAYLLGSVAYIKITYGDDYERQSIIQAYVSGNSTEQTITPNRGAILDRNLQPLAVSDIVYNVILDIRTLVTLKPEQIDKIVDTVCGILAIPDTDIRAAIAIGPDGKAAKDTHYHVIARRINHQTAESIRKASPVCVYLENDSQRRYVIGDFAPQIIGFLRGGGPGNNVGIERQYNTELTGENGRVFRTYNEDNEIVTEEIPAQNGASIVTTLDMDIQNIAQAAADEAAREYRPEYVSVTVMNPNTGEILGMAQYPSFTELAPSDLEFFTKPGMQELWDSLEGTKNQDEDRFKILKDAWDVYSTMHTFEPGSIFKPIVVAAALEEGLISANSTFYCGGHKQVSDRDLPCWIYKSGSVHGSQDVTSVLKNSCNVGMMDIIAILGKDLFYKYRTDFGFAEKTGIDLPDEESVSSRNVMYYLDDLAPVQLATSSFGQGFNCTPIQAMTAFAALINGGNVLKPYVVSRVMDSDGNIVRENAPEVVRKVISQETSDTIRHMLHEVVTPSGTGKKAVIEGYSMGGKTGTAQQGKYRDQYVVTFMAYLPVENPQYLALVVIDRPEGGEEVQGSTSAAPLLKTVMQQIIKVKNIAPDDDSFDPYEKAQSFDEVVMPDYAGLSLAETTHSLNSLGMDYSIIGGGDTVDSQYPTSGQQVPPGSKILIYARNNSGDDSGLVSVPDVSGLAAGDAIAKITNAGLVPVPVYPSASSDAGGEPVTADVGDGDYVSALGADNPSGVVFEQMPQTTALIERGTEVRLKIRF